MICVNPQFVDDDGAVEADETGYSGKQQQQQQHKQQQQQQHSSNEDCSSKTKQDDAVMVANRAMADFHRQTLAGRSGVSRTDGKLDGLGRGPDLAPMEEVVVGKPPSRERINSTSHYSTEKSGSSGYYSTNLYSTGGSSVDEHIYCEPIDRRTGPLDTEKKPTSSGALPSGSVMGTRSTMKRRNEGELQADHSIRLEQYYFPASLASPVQPVQLNVLRAATMTSNQHHSQQQQQQQQQHQSTKASAMAHLGDTTSAGDGGTGTEQQQQQQQQLSVIMEGTDGQIPRPIWPLDTDDSLMDINLESFRMANHSSQNLIGFESPSVRSSISDGEAYQRGDRQQQQQQQQPGTTTGVTVEAEVTTRKKSQYEEYLEFHNTRNILEQIRGKLNTLLEQQQQQQQQQQDASDQPRRSPGGSVVGPSTNPFSSASELERNIAVLKADLDGYLRTMNQKNENEIGRFCKGMSREPKVLAVQNAVEQRNRSRSGSIRSFEHEYELLERGHPAPFGQTVVFGGASNSTTGGADAGGSFLPYYQVLAPNPLDPDRRGIDVMPRDDGGVRPPAALPASVLALNRRSPPNPFAQEVRSSQMLQAGSSVGGGAGGLHSLCCQQRYLNNDEIRVCSRYGGCERNVTIDMPMRRAVDEDGDDDEDDDEDDESYIRGLDYGARVGRSVSCQGDAVDRGSGSGSGSGSVSIGIPDEPDRGRGRGHGGNDGRKHNGDSASDSGERPMAHCDFNQLQRNMTLERIILMESLGKSRTGQFGDKEKMLLEWHQNKPSCWELYYGANREEHKPHQTLIRKMKLGRKSTVCISYVSTAGQ
uniref:Uncharacterized protein n=1 Tax=Anopheles albimanus TaxID=7167 RepID=A0A182FFL6_ANOAL